MSDVHMREVSDTGSSSESESHDVLKEQKSQRDKEMRENGDKVKLERERKETQKRVDSLRDDVNERTDMFNEAKEVKEDLVREMKEIGYSETHDGIIEYNLIRVKFNEALKFLHSRVANMRDVIKNFNGKVEEHNNNVGSEEKRVQKITDDFDLPGEIEKTFREEWEAQKDRTTLSGGQAQNESQI